MCVRNPLNHGLQACYSKHFRDYVVFPAQQRTAWGVASALHCTDGEFAQVDAANEPEVLRAAAAHNTSLGKHNPSLSHLNSANDASPSFRVMHALAKVIKTRGSRVDEHLLQQLKSKYHAVRAARFGATAFILCFKYSESDSRK